ncbi:acyltransferase family protein [Burkholderia pseudomallei]|uniref:acyltransferase family protein n=1 Tax=Burkholderia pseudomallei TaxID=28450 RepID=UPI000E69A93B|nr:acyltransferase [Burkholderia pseudomallei]RIV54745.1 acyltransferase [Burkholderia pseudomallei]RIV58711.1 acyltransferase [Burkholderia pseudomallei]
MMELKKRSDDVDLLRGIAILLVLILHFHLTYRLHVLPFDVPWLSGAIKAISRNGNYGVTMFFAVSGFLITSTSARRFGSLGAIRPATFYRFRASRILPCLVLVLAVIVALGSLGMRSFVNKPDTASVFVSVLSVLTFWHNVLMAKVGYFNYSMNILWSLSVEEVFYLSFPILCLLLKRRRYILLFLCVPILVAPVYRSLHADDEIVALYGYLSCFDAIAMGACAALLPARAMSRGRSRAIQWIAGLAIAVTYLSGPIMQHVVWGVSVVAFSTAALLYCFRGGAPAEAAAPSFVSRFIGWFGQRSYELYLFHIVVLGVLREYVTRENVDIAAKPLWLLFYLCVSALVAQFVFKYYSEPLNAALRRGATRPSAGYLQK